jgi:type IV fimbrial biogenesis protein FimT
MDGQCELLDNPRRRLVLNSFGRSGGFSLIEMMIAIAIIGIALILGAPSYRTGLQNTQIRTAADRILSGLQLAKAEAVRRNYTVRFELGTRSSWTVGCTPEVADSADDTDTDPDCPGTIQQNAAAEGAPNAVVTPTQSSGTLPSPVSIVFNGLGRTNSLPAGAVINFDVSNPTGGTCVAAGGQMRCLRVVVSANGQIRMCDPAMTVVGDARAC